MVLSLSEQTHSHSQSVISCGEVLKLACCQSATENVVDCSARAAEHTHTAYTVPTPPPASLSQPVLVCKTAAVVWLSILRVQEKATLKRSTAAAAATDLRLPQRPLRDWPPPPPPPAPPPTLLPRPSSKSFALSSVLHVVVRHPSSSSLSCDCLVRQSVS